MQVVGPIRPLSHLNSNLPGKRGGPLHVKVSPDRLFAQREPSILHVCPSLNFLFFFYKGRLQSSLVAGENRPLLPLRSNNLVLPAKPFTPPSFALGALESNCSPPSNGWTSSPVPECGKSREQTLLFTFPLCRCGRPLTDLALSFYQTTQDLFLLLTIALFHSRLAQ